MFWLLRLDSRLAALLICACYCRYSTVDIDGDIFLFISVVELVRNSKEKIIISVTEGMVSFILSSQIELDHSHTRIFFRNLRLGAGRQFFGHFITKRFLRISYIFYTKQCSVVFILFCQKGSQVTY